MLHIDDQPDIRPFKDRKGRTRYVLATAFCYEWDEGLRKSRLTIEAGFEHDGASVPRAVWTLSGLRPDGLIRAAALVRYYLYQHNGLVEKGAGYQFFRGDLLGRWIDCQRYFERKEADQLFRQMMRQDGVGRLQTWMAYRAVRWFGRGVLKKGW